MTARIVLLDDSSDAGVIAALRNAILGELFSQRPSLGCVEKQWMCEGPSTPFSFRVTAWAQGDSLVEFTLGAGVA